MRSLMGLLFCVSVSTGMPRPRQQRLSLADWGSYSYRDHKGPGTYAFGYDVEDPVTNNVQFRQEERHRNGTVTGSYGYLEPSGHAHIIHYIADARGYRITIEKPTPIIIPTPPSTTLPTPEEHAPVFEGEFYPAESVDEEDENQLNEFANQVLPELRRTPPTRDLPYSQQSFRGPSGLYRSTTVPMKPIVNYALKPRKSALNFTPVLIYNNPNGVEGGRLKFKVKLF